MAEPHRFVCPTCKLMLGKGDGEHWQAYCRRCAAVRDAIRDLRELSKTIVTSGQSNPRR